MENMKKYIKPAIKVQGIVVENLLAALSNEDGQIKESKAKGNSDLWIEDDEVSPAENASW